VPLQPGVEARGVVDHGAGVAAAAARFDRAAC
jgi:hypothetical protein